MYKKIFAMIFLTTIILNCSHKTEEEKGYEKVKAKTDLLKGAGNALINEGGESSEKLSQGVSKVIKGSVKGFKEGLNKMSFEMSENVQLKGLNITRVTQQGPSEITIYVIFNKSYKGKCLIKAMDESNQEIGRSVNAIKGIADEAKYVDFSFDNRTPFSSIKKFVIDIK